MANTPNRAPPSINPTNYGSLTGMLGFVMTKWLQGIDDMLPAEVVAYNRATNLAQVQPLIPMVTTDGITIARAPLQSIPVVQAGGGGFLISFPIQPGDLGFIKANDRDISIFIQSWQSSIPNTARKHSFSDGVFIPNVFTGYTISGGDAANMVIQSLDNSVKITLAPTAITVEAPTVTVVSTGGVTNITGNLHVSADVVISGKSFLSHVHGGVMSGGSDTGVPV